MSANNATYMAAHILCPGLLLPSHTVPAQRETAFFGLCLPSRSSTNTNIQRLVARVMLMTMLKDLPCPARRFCVPARGLLLRLQVENFEVVPRCPAYNTYPIHIQGYLTCDPCEVKESAGIEDNCLDTQYSISS